MSASPTHKVRELGSPAPLANDGFDGQLRCASLADLIQLECLSRARAAISVRSNGRQGHLFFEQGDLIHATTGNLIGDDAAFEILTWSTGTFGDSAQPWPAQRSVMAAWQQLLLTAAQQRDEQLRDALSGDGEAARSASRLVAVSTLRPPAVEARGAAPITQRPPPKRLPSSMPQPIPTSNRDVPGRDVSSSDVSGRSEVNVRAARLSRSGQLLAARGDAAGLVDLGAYLQQLTGLIGSDLGMLDFRELQWERATSRLALYAEEDSFLVVEAPLGSDMAGVRRGLGW